MGLASGQILAAVVLSIAPERGWRARQAWDYQETRRRALPGPMPEKAGGTPEVFVDQAGQLAGLEKAKPLPDPPRRLR